MSTITSEDVLRVMDAADLPVSASDLKIDAPFVAQGLDSLDVATLMVAVESNFKKVIPEEQMPRLRSIRDLVLFLND
jgi:acyl carrier protein